MADIKRVIGIAIGVGEEIIRAGGEVSRAEDSVSRISKAFGMKRCDVFALNTYIAVSIENIDGDSAVLSRRIKTRGTDLKRLEQINELSRELCDGRANMETAEKILYSANGEKNSVFRCYAISMAVCGVFTLYFGGGIEEACVAALASTITVFLKRKVKNGFGNAVIFTFICSFACGSAGALLIAWGLAQDYGVVAKGDIMLLVPGVSLVCAGRDIISGELLTGLLELIEVLLIAMALAAGFVLPEAFLNGFV